MRDAMDNAISMHMRPSSIRPSGEESRGALRSRRIDVRTAISGDAGLARVMQLILGVVLLCCVGGSILAVITLIVPRIYNVKGTSSIALPENAVYRNTSSTDAVVVLPDFTIDIGVAYTCYGGTSCASPGERGHGPVPAGIVEALQNGWLFPNITGQVSALMNGGALDLSLFRGEDACGTSYGAAKNLRGLIILSLGVAAVANFVVLIPVTALQQRIAENGKVVSAVHAGDWSYLSNNAVKVGRATPSKEIFWLALALLVAFLGCGGMVVAVVLRYQLDDHLYCEGDSTCRIITNGLKAFAATLLGDAYDPNTIQFTCGSGAAQVSLWVALVVSAVGFVLLVVLWGLYSCGKRRAYLIGMQERIEEMSENATLRASQMDQPAPTSVAASRTPASTRGAGTLAPPASTPSPSPGGRRLMPLRSSSAMKYTSPRNGSTASSMDEHAAMQSEWSSIAEKRGELMTSDEHIERVALRVEERIAFAGQFSLIKRKLWRCERVEHLHQWCHDWFFGPQLDLNVEETFHRQALIRKWFEKLLDRSVNFPPVPSTAATVPGEEEGDGAILPPFALRLVDVDEALSWASIYRLEDDDDPHSTSGDGPDVPPTHTSSPMAQLRHIPYFEQQWRCIIDSPTSRYYRDSIRGPSVEVSSASSDEDDGGEAFDNRMIDTSAADSSSLLAGHRVAPRGLFQTPPQRVGGGETPAERNRALIESRSIYPALYSPSERRKQSSPPRLSENTRLDFKAVTKANDELRRAYELAVRRSTSRPNFDRGFNAAKDAAADFQHAIQRAQAYPYNAGGAVASTTSSPQTPPPPIRWDARPDASWGEAAVAERLEHLSKISRAQTTASTIEEDDDLR